MRTTYSSQEIDSASPVATMRDLGMRLEGTLSTNSSNDPSRTGRFNRYRIQLIGYRAPEV